MSVSETIEALGDLSGTIADEQLFGDADFFSKESRQDYLKDLPKGSSIEYPRELSGEFFKYKYENADLADLDMVSFDEFDHPLSFDQDHPPNRGYYQPDLNPAQDMNHANINASTNANAHNHSPNTNIHSHAQNVYHLGSQSLLATGTPGPISFTSSATTVNGAMDNAGSNHGGHGGGHDDINLNIGGGNNMGHMNHSANVSPGMANIPGNGATSGIGSNDVGSSGSGGSGARTKEMTSPPSYEEPFQIDLEMVRRTMEGVNSALNVDLGGTEIGETVLLDNPLGDESGEGEQRDGSTTKAEMSHVRLISDACGHIVVSVGRAVLQAAREAVKENAMAGVYGQRPKPPIRKKRGGILGFKELAQRANLSPWHFHRVFRFVTGVTPKAYGEALWEFLMVEAGFDLDNEELSINLSKSRGPEQHQQQQQQQQQQLQQQTPSSHLTSQNSSPTPPSSAVETFLGRLGPGLPSSVPSLASGSSQASTDGHSEANSPTHAFHPKASTPVSTAQSAELRSPLQPSQQQQPLAPLSGPVPPGRIRKSSSSRGARSRSRNRTQTSGVLSGLNSEPDSTGAQVRRGRSFSRLAQRPVFVTTDQALQGVFPAPGIPPIMGLADAPPSNMPNMSSNMSTNLPSNMANNIPNNMHMGPPPDNLVSITQGGGPNQYFDVPDLNNLTLQPETDSQHGSNVPPMAQEFMPHMHRPSQVSPHTQLGGPRDGFHDKGHHRVHSTGALPKMSGPYNNYFVPAQALSMGFNESSRGRRAAHPNSQAANTPRLLDHPGMLMHSNSNPNSGRSSPRLDMQGHNFHDDLQRELMLHERHDEDAKHDQLSDLPASFYSSMDDKSAFETSFPEDNFSSALIGADDPPLAAGWNDASTDDNFLF